MALESSTSHIVIPPAKVVKYWVYIDSVAPYIARLTDAPRSLTAITSFTYLPAMPFIKPYVKKELRDGQPITIDTWFVIGIADFSDPALVLRRMQANHFWSRKYGRRDVLRSVNDTKSKLSDYVTRIINDGYKQYEPDFLAEVGHKQREVDKICNNCRLESEILEFYVARVGQHHTPARNFTTLKASLNTFHDKIAEQRAAFEIFVEKRISEIKAGSKTNLAAAIEVQNYEFNFTELEKRMKTMRAMKHDDHAIEYEDNLFGEAYLTTREPIKRQKVLDSINASSSLWANG